MVFGSITKVSAALILLCLAGCRQNGPRRLPAIGQAYVGPAVLNLHRDISPQSPTAATVKHGERLEILQQRRVFLRVRTEKGAEGWTSASQLMSAADMADMKQLGERAAKMPLQGEATVYDALNVHTQPAAHSPSFMQLAAKEKFAVLAHVVTPRIDPPHAPLVKPAPKKAPAAKKDTKTAGRIPPPPMPKAPPLPSNWIDLSHQNEEGENATEDDAQAAAPPVGQDDWSLIRTAAGQTGWVLTRKLTMAIPDEVAQYAEGHRIVSYFSLGDLQDGDARKNIWLWTTVGDGHPPYDFSSFRVFIWNLRRHRYETAYIERSIEGYSPVLVQQVSYGGAGKSGAPANYPGFSICMRKKDGSLVRRDYALLTNIVRFAGEQACQMPPPVFNVDVFKKPVLPLQSASSAAPAPAAESTSFLQRMKTKLKGLLHRR